MNRPVVPVCTLILGFAAALALLYTPSPSRASIPEASPAVVETVAVPSAPSTPEVVPAPAPAPVKPVAVPPVVQTPAPAKEVVPGLPPAVPAGEVGRLPGAEAPVPSFSSGSAAQKQVALTFDDGPHPTITPLVLDELRARGVKATFFVIGDRVKAYPWVLRQVVAEGHEIGNHTYSHRLLTAMSTDLIRREVGETQEAIRNAIGYETRLFRPPYGAFRPSANAVFREYGLNVIRWSVDPRDWRNRDAVLISNHVTHQSKNGAIILCHDIHRATLQALPTILDTLIAEGYEFKTVSELCGLPPLQVITAAHTPSEPAPEAKN